VGRRRLGAIMLLLSALALLWLAPRFPPANQSESFDDSFLVFDGGEPSLHAVRCAERAVAAEDARCAAARDTRDRQFVLWRIGTSVALVVAAAGLLTLVWPRRRRLFGEDTDIAPRDRETGDDWRPDEAAWNQYVREPDPSA
jgi:hypothetical protein